MTDTERLCTGIAISLFAHFLLFNWGWKEEPPRVAFNAVVHLDMNPMAAEQAPRRGLGLSSPPSEVQEPNRLASMKRKAFLRFLEDVSDAVHARRLDTGGRNLIGVAEYRFLIFPDGRFSDPELSASSGRADLDAAAKRAIRAASGVVKRPSILGAEPIPLTLQVKYQYGLR